MKHPYLLSFLLLSSWTGFAQIPGNLIPRELLFKEKEKTRITLSKDGEAVIYQKEKDGPDSTLYYIHTESPNAEQKKRFDGELVSWMPAYLGGLVAVVKQDTNLSVRYTTLRAVEIKKLEITPFTQLDLLMVNSRFPNKILVGLTAKDEKQNGMYLLDLFTGKLRRMMAPEGFSELFYDLSFSTVAGLKTNELGGHSLCRFVNGQQVEVFKHGPGPDMFIGGLNKIIGVSNDGKTIYATDNTGKDKTTLVSIDAETGLVTELASDPDADILPFAATFDTEGKPSSVVALWGDTKRHCLDSLVQKDFDFLNKNLNGNVGFAGASEDNKIWLVRALDGGPVKYYLYRRTDQKLTYLLNDYPYLDPYELGSRKAYTVTTKDGLKLPVHVYLPPGMAKTDGSPKVPMPTIIYVHGGPWAGVTHWNSWFHTRNFQLLANRGYAVINMEFRGATGLGKQMTDAGDLQWGGAMHNDIVDVANWAIKAGVSNPRRIGLWGWSYGGYATNFALGQAPSLFACGISMYGITDLYEFGKLPFADNDLWHSRVGDPSTKEGADLLKKYSPIAYVKQIQAPMLITTGTLDDRVPQEQNDKFAKALSDARKEVVYFYYPEEGHDYRRPESWVSFWAIAEDFLHEKVGGRKEARKEDIEKGNFKIMFGEEYIEGIED